MAIYWGQVKLDGGLHLASLDRLEGEFQRILSVDILLGLSLTNQPVRKADTSSNRKLSAQTLKSLHLIVQKLASNGRRQRCMDLYIDSRVRFFKESLKALPLNYLQIKPGTKIDWKSVGMYIGPWTQHMEVVIKSLCEPEYQLCN